MSFNVENLFDTEDDPDRDDETFLPLSKKQDPKVRAACEKNDSAYRRSECLNNDWTQAGLEIKMSNISKVVFSADENGPDNLLLIEVENNNVLTQLNKNYLAKAGYQTQVLIEGPDKRGIDVAFLSRFPLVGTPVLHQIEWQPKNDKDKEWMFQSRNILEVVVKAPNGDPITFLVAHFPSQSNPRYWREQASQYLTKLILSKGPNAMVVAAGDLNITHEEEEEAGFFISTMSQAGAVSHLVGCKDCPGTHYYRRSWSFLDAQIYSKALLTDGAGSYVLEPETISVVRYNDVHLKRGKYPNRWDIDEKTGVSDHFPLYARLKMRSEAKSPVLPPPPPIEEKKVPAKKSPKKK